MPKKEKKLTPQQVKKIVEEVNIHNKRLLALTEGELKTDFAVHWITALWELPGECYLVRYDNHATDFFRRDPATKQLRGVLRTSYFAPHWTNNPKHGHPTELEKEIEKRLKDE